MFDSSNYAQNLLQAARALTQINNQIRSLQNEAVMLQGMARHLERLDFSGLSQMTATLQKIDRLMGTAEGIGFRMRELDARFRSLFPNSFDTALESDQRVREARTRVDSAMAAFQQSMGVQAQVVENVQDDAALLARLVTESQGAAGSLQVSQATNQLLALTAKQQLQIQNLMAAQFRAETVERARRVQAETDARAATRQFLGSGRAYTPE